MTSLGLAGLLIGAALVVAGKGESCKKNVDCLVNGVDYIGKETKTKSGYTCQNWDSQTPHQHGFKWVSSGWKNYCRSPDGDSTPWCYTTHPRVRWAHCNIKMCGDCDTVACGTVNVDCANYDGEFYYGNATKTLLGYDCQKWNKPYPHYHTFNLD